MKEELFKKLSQAVIQGQKDECVELTKQLLGTDLSAKEILDNGLLPGMDVVGVRFRDNQIFVPQVLISARAMKSSLALLEPLLSKADIKANGTIVIGTVKGDIHDIGKNIVSMMFRSNGFTVIDLGIDASADKFIEAVIKEEADIIGMSALLTTTMSYMKTVIERIKTENINAKVMIGGAPVSQSFANQIGADGFAHNATDAVKVARELIGLNKKGNIYEQLS